MSTTNLSLLRENLKQRNLDGFVVPRVDLYQGEYVVEADERLAWSSGFTGSAGMLIVLADKAFLFTDGRYTLQAKDQVNSKQITVLQTPEESPHKTLKKLGITNVTLGLDPWLVTQSEWDRWQKLSAETGIKLQLVDDNPIDQIWTDRPKRPLDPVTIHPQKFAGKSSSEKLMIVRETMKSAGIEAFVLNAPDSVCWLLNIRGTDFPYTPMVDGLAILHAEGPVELFVDQQKMPPEIEKHLGKTAVSKSPGDLAKSLKYIKNKRVGFDPTHTPLSIINALNPSTLVKTQDPCVLAKALKTKHEIDGIRAAHLRDGVALTKFLAWLSSQEPDTVTEMTAADKLEEFRAQGQNFQGLSFPTIAGFGSNGAIVHYRSSPATCKSINESNLFLLDSGAQYLDGTTDVTRTICLGEPTTEQRRHFTLVLKGHIGLARTRFPEGTTGSQMDVLARHALWQDGLDYDHGTGHGVGHFLNVHEGPQRISKAANSIPLQEGMVVSNEPGYYREGQYGIRIENLVVVQRIEGDFERNLLCFETLTLAPISRNLIDEDMLMPHEWQWLNEYHARVRDTLLPYLDPDSAAWLIDATEEI